MNNQSLTSTQLYVFLNLAAVLIAYAMMCGSLWYAPVDFSTKGYWGMGILMLSISLINVVKYRFDDVSRQDRIRQLEDAKNDKLLKDYVTEA
jgi:hypothetical protein